MSWQDRLREEHEQLKDRAIKLGAFMDSEEYDQLDPEHQAWLLIQSYAMSMYSDALEGRVGLL